MFEIGNSLREARFGRVSRSPGSRPTRRSARSTSRALEEERFEVLPGRDVRQGLPADVRGATSASTASSTWTSSTRASPRRRRSRSDGLHAPAAPAAPARVEPRRRRPRGDRRRHGARRRRARRDRHATTRTRSARRRRTTTTGSPARDHARDAGDGQTSCRPIRRSSSSPPRAATAGSRCATAASTASSLYEGTLEQGQVQRSCATARLWLDLEEPREPERQAERHAGRLPSEPAVVVVTPRGRPDRLDRHVVSPPACGRRPHGQRARARRRAPTPNGAFLARELTRLGLEPARIAARRRRSRRARGGDPGRARGRPLRPLRRPRADARRPHGRAARPGGRAGARRRRGRSRAEIEGVSRGVAERLGRPVRGLRARRPQAGVPPGRAPSRSASRARRRRCSSSTTARVAVALPGPPGRAPAPLAARARAEAVPRLLARVDAAPARVLRLFGPSEAAVASAVEEAGGEAEGLEVTVCAHDLEIRGRPVRRRTGGASRARRVAAALRERFGAELFAEDERPVAELVLDALPGARARRWRRPSRAPAASSARG